MMTTPGLDELLAAHSPTVRETALSLRALMNDVVPDAAEELDQSAELIAFTFIPGTYKGLFTAIALHKAHVNLMFSKGAELTDLDTEGLLEGTGKKARHITFRSPDLVANPHVRTLIEAAANRTPRS